jgi:uncharacterized membrane protein
MIPLTIATALGSGLVGGAFYAFSSFVMPALERLPAHEGIAAMQSINVTAVQPPFMVGFIGTALASAATIVVGAFELSEAHGAYMVAGGALYLIGTFGLTIAFHVPRNDALAPIDPAAPASPQQWQRYLREWVPGNHVRTLAGLAAAALLTVAVHVH